MLRPGNDPHVLVLVAQGHPVLIVDLATRDVPQECLGSLGEVVT